MKFVRISQAAAILAVGALGLTACGSDNPTGDSGNGGNGGGGDTSVSGTLTGAGASAQSPAMDAWRAGFQGKYPQANIQYSPDGSGAGRKAFIAGGVQFAGSDKPMSKDELEQAKGQCPSGALNLPMYVSPIVVTFNLEGIKELNLSPEVIAKIFNGEISKWNDEAIAADNADVELPSTDITVVHRSDDSGTTENFTEYLHAAAPDDWTTEADGVWPGNLGGENAKGTQGVVSTVTSTNGAITYADESAVSGDLGRAKVKSGDEWVEVSADAAAKTLEESDIEEGRAQHDIALDINRTPEAGAYPIILVSYHIVCSTYADQNVVDLVKAFEGYVGSSEGQEEAQKSAGNAPLSEKLEGDVKSAVDSISVRS